MSEIAENLARVRARIAAAANRAGRDPKEITLVAVTKTVSVQRMREAFDAGIRDFGESYYQESREKLDQFDGSVRWHFIGHLQSNKARYIAGRFALIHSVDSVELAREIGARATRNGIVQPILLEVKLDPAETKFGISLDVCLGAAREVAQVPSIDLQGFMGMAPYGQDPEMSRPCFQKLNAAFRQLPERSQKTLSMGMTGDFEVAIEEGATHVRIGTAIFGLRNTP
jgi:pyridoxal phosphate enzyme (YggS family)